MQTAELARIPESFINKSQYLDKLVLDDTRNFILNFFRSRQIPDADDMAQEVIARAVKAINNGQFNGNSEFNTWLYRIAKHLLIDKFRRQATKQKKGAGS